MSLMWISVEDRLPSKNVVVWCYCFEDYEQRGIYRHTSDYDDCQAHIFQNDFDGYISVTHWMPLPEPPDSDQRRQNQ